MCSAPRLPGHVVVPVILRIHHVASHIHTPTLLLWGTADPRVTRAETDAIFAHLAGPKARHDFPGVGHEPYWKRYSADWEQQTGGVGVNR